MENSLKPSYIQIRYHSALGFHKMTLPTRQHIPIGVGAPAGSFEAWDTSARLAHEMVEDFVDLLLPKFPTSVVFDDYTIFNFNTGAGFFIPVAGTALTAKIGTDATPGWFYAVQSVFTMFDTEYSTAKITLLDTSSRNNFALRTAATADAEEIAIFNEYSSPLNAWSSRNGARPSTLRSVSLGINDALKKQYGII